jgi:hypothetical protein
MTEAERLVWSSGFEAGVQMTMRLMRDNVTQKIQQERDRLLAQMGAVPAASRPGAPGPRVAPR